ncbi:MAG: hypothetical protein L0Y56_17850 [Nitrospira sp.]|nr:hypothetical protein [Nitrospira sp.]
MSEVALVFRPFFLPGLLWFVSACSPITHHYIQVEHYISRQDFFKADAVIEKQAKGYGAKNVLLYDMDRAMALHLAGQYIESNKFLDLAEQRAEQLYTKSLTAEAGAMLTNDNTLPYEGEDFERVMINLIAALNYIYLDEIDEALVETRKVDHKLNLLNDRYEKKNVYKEDAFARYLSGILYEAKAESSDAWIDYRKAYEAYQDYQKQYGTPIPQMLKADLLRMTDLLGLTVEHREYLDQFGTIPWMRHKEYRRYGEIILISYNGLSPVKEDYFITAPVPDGEGGVYILNIAMPRFISRPTDVANAIMKVQGTGVTPLQTVLVEDITAIAIKNLENRIGRITAKAIARATAKYMVSRTIREKANKEDKPLPRILSDVGTNLYSLLSEQSDKRSWRTLPGEVQMARLLVPPGTYQVEVQYLNRHGQEITQRAFPEVKILAGEKKFLSSRVVGSVQSP